MEESIGFIMMYFIGRIILSLLFYRSGKKRRIGGGWAFVAVFFLGLWGMIIVWCSKKKEARDYVEISSHETQNHDYKEYN